MTVKRSRGPIVHESCRHSFSFWHLISPCVPIFVGRLVRLFYVPTSLSCHPSSLRHPRRPPRSLPSSSLVSRTNTSGSLHP